MDELQTASVCLARELGGRMTRKGHKGTFWKEAMQVLCLQNGSDYIVVYISENSLNLASE